MLITDSTKKLIEAALLEDVGQGDITSNAVIPADAEAIFAFTAREKMTICGMAVAAEIFAMSGDAVHFEARCQDGDKLQEGTQFAIIRGNAREILKLERVVLNFLQHLSGISTLTAKFVAETCNTRAKIYDTRKTTPAFRDLEKYAVKCGGGENHRMRLDDMVLIKDNHIAAAGGIAAAVATAREFVQSNRPEFVSGAERGAMADEFAPADIKIMLEVDNLQQLDEAFLANPDIIMIDNFSLEDMKTAVDRVSGKIPLEASGGVNLQTVRGISETGVDRISTSKITQSAPAVDIGLDEI